MLHLMLAPSEIHKHDRELILAKSQLDFATVLLNLSELDYERYIKRSIDVSNLDFALICKHGATSYHVFDRVAQIVKRACEFLHLSAPPSYPDGMISRWHVHSSHKRDAKLRADIHDTIKAWSDAIVRLRQKLRAADDCASDLDSATSAYSLDESDDEEEDDEDEDSRGGGASERSSAGDDDSAGDD